jgi:LysR family glycine cleavage system transcriptional activator
VPRRLPPFQALRALEAACRHQSYSAAAAELHVTHGAISQQIRRLEEEFGQCLFDRVGHRMMPSPAAQALAAKVAEALTLLREGVEVLDGRGEARALVLSVLPSFARFWMTPRIPQLARAFPDLTLDLRTERRLADLDREGVDLAIRVGSGTWPPLKAEPLTTLAIFPVCTPALAAELDLKSPEELVRAPIIDGADTYWNDWLPGAAPRRGPASTLFDDAGLVMDAALQGQGVALGRDLMVRADLEAGRLVRLFAPLQTAGSSYYAVWSPRSRKQPMIEAFVAWLQSELAAEGQAAAGPAAVKVAAG